MIHKRAELLAKVAEIASVLPEIKDLDELEAYLTDLLDDVSHHNSQFGPLPTLKIVK